MWLQIRQTYIAQFYLKLISNSVQRVFVFLFLTMCTFNVISSRKHACELDTGVSRSRLGLIEMLMRGRWCQQTLHAVERVGSPQEFFPCFVLTSNMCRNYEGDILHCHVTRVKYVHNYARHLPQQHLDATGMRLFEYLHPCVYVWHVNVFLPLKTETSRISADTNGHVRVNGRVGPVTEQILQLLNECFSDDRCEQRRLRSFSNRVRVCLLGGPWNSFSTLGCMYVCRTITGLRQWRFCGTTIGGNAAAKKCVRSSPADEPHEKCEWKKRKLQGNGNIFLHIYCHDFGVLLFIHSLFISALSLLSCLLSALLFFPLPPCSTCLSELGRARCTHRTGEGPCLLSINNLLEFRNTSRSCLWQAVPHSRGRAFRHTRRNPYLLLAFSLTVSPGLTVWSPPQWLITPLQTTSAALCVRTYWGTLWLSPAATASVWTASVATGMKPTTQGFTFVPSVRSHSPRGLYWGPTPLWAWWQRRSRRAVWTSTSARPRGASLPDQTTCPVTSASGRN